VCADGKLSFRGLVASPDGREVHETSRSGEWSEESVLRLGREAGEELKASLNPTLAVPLVQWAAATGAFGCGPAAEPQSA
jgi:porphobilinogen deaminase